MEICILVNGLMVKRMGKEFINMQIKIIMKDIFRKEKDKEEEHTNGEMEINILDNGKMIKWKEQVK